MSQSGGDEKSSIDLRLGVRLAAAFHENAVGSLHIETDESQMLFPDS